MKNGRIIAVCSSKKKGTPKQNIGQGVLIKSKGLKGDAHAAKGIRQVSLLAIETIDKVTSLGKKHGLELGPGSFAENLTTQGIALTKLPIGTKLSISTGAILRITQIGKQCHTGCAIRKAIGDCVMPREGVFVDVLKGGKVRIGDKIVII
jgi:MOSC domain-containing protein YiiM